MPEQSTSRRDRSLSPLLLLIILLLLFLLGFALSSWLLNQCLAKLTPPSDDVAQAQVLGVTNLDVSSDLNQAQGGGVVNFSVTGDHDQPLNNALIIFDTTGMGTIQSAPVGSGLCIKVSDTQATCTGVNLLSNQAINYVVPVAVDTTCGLLGTDRVGLNVTVDQTDVEDATANGDVGCVATNTSSSGTTSTMSSGTTSRTASSTLSGTSTTSDVSVSGNSDGQTLTASEYADRVAACYADANKALALAIGIPLLLLLVIYAIAMANKKKEQM